jgi:hypothetical protein
MKKFQIIILIIALIVGIFCACKKDKTTSCEIVKTFAKCDIEYMANSNGQLSIYNRSGCGMAIIFTINNISIQAEDFQNYNIIKGQKYKWEGCSNCLIMFQNSCD